MCAVARDSRRGAMETLVVGTIAFLLFLYLLLAMLRPEKF
jgi:K+-transporting ATPase KdpF subunit